MTKLRGVIYGTAILLLFKQSPVQAEIVVKTRTPEITQFYWIVRDQDRNREMRRIPGVTVEAVIRRFRRYPFNDRPVPTKDRVAYSVYLQCQGQGGMRPPDGIPVDGGQPHVWVNC